MLIESFLTALLSVTPANDARPAQAAPVQMKFDAGAKLAQAPTSPSAPTSVKTGATAEQKPAPSTKPAEQKEATRPAAPAKAQEAAPAKSAPAMSAEVKDLVDRMQAFYEKTDNFTADFEQRYTYKAFKRTQTSNGTMAFMFDVRTSGGATLKAPLMRWEYVTPSKKTFVLAGDRVYMHDPQAMLLTKASIATNQLSASVTFLWGQGKLADEFSIAKAACEKCAGVLLEMTPLKPDPRFKKILLEVDPKSAQVLKSTVIDPNGDENAITFKNLKTNVGVSKDTFKLDPPPGTQVQDFTKPQSAGGDAGTP